MASQEILVLDSSSDGTEGPGDAHWLDGDNSRVKDNMDFITCARDTFVTDEDVNLAAL